MPSIHHRHRRQQTPPTPLLTPQNDPSSKQENTGLAKTSFTFDYSQTTCICVSEWRWGRRGDGRGGCPLDRTIDPSLSYLCERWWYCHPACCSSQWTIIYLSFSRYAIYSKWNTNGGAGQSLFGPYNFDPLYFPYPPYLPYGPYPQRRDSQHANLPKKSIFSRLKGFFRSSHSPANPQPFTAIYLQPFTQPFDWHVAVVDFTTVAFKQMYLVLLLRLPSLYFSLVAQIFVQAHMSLPEIKKMALETASQGLTHEFEMQMAFESRSPTVTPAYKSLTKTWEFSIDSVTREWKTSNIISALFAAYVTFQLSLLLLPNLILA